MELKNVQILSIGEIKEITATYKNLNFVVKTEENYPQTIEFQIANDKADKFLQYNKVGQFVDIDFNLKGRQWTNPQGEVKTFNTLDAWKVFKAEGNAAPQQQASAPSPQAPQTEEADLPF